MVSDTPTDGRCNADVDGGYCEGWQMDNGRCYSHGGRNDDDGRDPGGAPKANQNAKRHGLHSTPQYLQRHLDEHHEDTYIALFESLCTRYERVHAQGPDYAAKKRLQRVCIEIVKEDLADEWLAQEADESGNLLMEHRTVVDDDSGEVLKEYDVPNSVLEPLAQLKRETRMTLKDMGLLIDPETKKADAMAEAGQAYIQALKRKGQQ